MRAYSNMTTHEFVGQLRDIAIQANARPAVMDQIDLLTIRPTDDEIASDIEDAEDTARWDGRKTQWEFCFDALDLFLSNKKSGYTAAQRAQLLEVLKNVEPKE